MNGTSRMSVLIAASLWWGNAGIAQPTLRELVRVEPNAVIFERAAPEEVFQFSIELVNDSEHEIRAMSVMPNCPCTVPIGFQPRNVAPGESLAVSLQITAPDQIGKTQGVVVFVAIDSGLAIPCDLMITAVDPRVRTVELYVETMREWGQAMAQRYVSHEALKWFLSRDGEGAPFFSRGAWADWDDLFGSTFEIRSMELEGEEVLVTSVEDNDFYRLIERTPTPATTRYWFDEEGKILGKVYLGRGEGATPTDRLEEFTSWLTEREPAQLEQLMPGGEIDPALDKAKQWKPLLVEWRREAGLPGVALDSKGG